MTTLITSNGIRFLVEDEKKAHFLEKTIGYADQLRANRDQKNEAKKMAFLLRVRDRYERQLARAEEAAAAKVEAPTVEAEIEVQEEMPLEEESIEVTPSEEN